MSSPSSPLSPPECECECECVIIGAGPVGCCLALLLSSEGVSCEVIDWRSEQSIRAVGKNRTHNFRGINLGLSARGLSALALLGLKEEVLSISVKMLGRIVHMLPSNRTEASPQLCFQRYGSSDSHFVCSVDRDDVNKILFEKCLQTKLIRFSLQQKFRKLTIEGKEQYQRNVLTLESVVDGSLRTRHLECPVFGCDGASSAVRQEIFRFLPSKDEMQLPDLLHWQKPSEEKEKEKESVQTERETERGRESESETTSSGLGSPKVGPSSPKQIPLSSPPRRMRENSFSAQQIIQSSPLSPKHTASRDSKTPLLSPLSPSTYLPGVTWSRKYLDYGYKALLLDVSSEERKDMFLRNGIHLWPRSHFLAIGPPHIDNKINFLLFLPLEEGSDEEKDSPCFRHLITEDKVQHFFSTHFADLKEFHTELVQQFMSLPIGTMSSVTCSEWFFEDKVLLLGDSAHAIVPFLGQGLNAGLQDCEIFIRMFKEKRAAANQNEHKGGGGGSKFQWSELFSEFTSNRFVDVESVSLMTLETFLEMRDQVGSAEYIRKKALESKLQHCFPFVFLSRYSLVTFHTIPYSVAYEAGLKSMHIVETLLEEGCSPDLIDAHSEWKERALDLIQSQFYPYIKPYLEQEANMQPA